MVAASEEQGVSEAPAVEPGASAASEVSVERAGVAAVSVVWEACEAVPKD